MLTIQDALSLAYVAVMGVGVVNASILTVYAAKRAHTKVGQGYLFMVASMGLVILCFLLHSISPTPELTRFFTRLRFVILPFVPVFSMYYVAVYTGWRDLFRLPAQLFLFVIPLVTAIVVMSPALEGLFWQSWDYTAFGLVRVELPRYSLGFYLYNLHSFVLVATFYTLLIRYGLRSTASARRRALWIAAGHTFAYIIILSTVFGLLPRGSLNLTPLGFTVLVTFILYIAVHFRVLDTIPIAYEHLIRSMQDPIIITDLRGRIIEANFHAEKLMGAVRDDLVGKDHSELIDTSPKPARELLCATAGQHEITIHTSEIDLSYDVNISVLVRETGGDYARLLVFRDITERKRTENQREEMIHDLDAYAHIVAHDIKNPLSLVLAYADLSIEALNEKTPDDLPVYINNIRMSANRIHQITEDILVFATVRDQTVVKAQPTDVQGCLQRAIERLEPFIDSSNGIVKTPDDLPAGMGIESWIDQVWTNFITNALKYGGQPPHIWISAEIQGVFVRYSVRDNGAGLSPEQTKHLFYEVTRLEPSRASGTGLGLTIVQRIVRKLGGAVGVESAPGKGSTFWFTLPLASNSHQQKQVMDTQLQLR